MPGKYGAASGPGPEPVPVAAVAAEPRELAGAQERGRTAGALEAPDRTIGIRLSGDKPSSWLRWLDLLAAGSEAILKHEKLELRADGTLYMPSGTIAANMLILGSFDNLVDNPGFEASTTEVVQWKLISGYGGAIGLATSNYRSGLQALSIDVAGQTGILRVANQSRIAVDDDTRLYGEAWVRRATASTASRVRVRFSWRNNAGTLVGQTTSTPVTPTDSYQRYSLQTTSSPPAGTAYGQFEVEVLDDSYSTDILVDDVYVRRIIEGTLITGRIEDATGTRGILLSGSLPGGWGQYLNLAAGTYLLYHPKLKLTQSGEIEFSGKIINEGVQSAIARHVQSGVAYGPSASGDISVSFPEAYVNAPVVEVFPHQILSYNTSLGSGNDQRLRLQAVNITVNGFTARAVNCTIGTTTGQWDDFPDENLLDAYGETAEATITPAGANDSQYTVHYYVSVTAYAQPEYSSSVNIVVAIDSWNGSSWTERAAYAYGAATPAGAGSPQTNTWSHEQKTVGLTLSSGDKLRLRIKDYTETGAGGYFSVRGFEQIGGRTDPAHGVTYTTASDTTESAVPLASDAIRWVATEAA